MTLAKNSVIAVVGIVLALGMYALVKEGGLAGPFAPKAPVATTTPPVDEEVHYSSYRSDTYGIAFSYPEGYVMSEKSGKGELAASTAISLIRQQDLPVPQNGEGPTAISIDFYPNHVATSSLEKWLATDASNFKLSSGALASTTVSGAEAIQYRWSGLYEGETTAFVHDGAVIAVSVTYFAPEDENVAVYRKLLQSIQLFSVNAILPL